MVSITLPPQNLQTFNELVRAVPAQSWRIRMDLMPGGMKALNLKENASDLQQLHFCRSSNV